MTWYSIYVTATGELRGHTSIQPTGLPGTMATATHANRMDQTMRWNPTTKAWDTPIPVPVLVDRLQDLAGHPYAATVWSQLTVAQRQKLRQIMVWLMGSRRYRQVTEDVAVDVPDGWPSDPSGVGNP